MVTMLCSQYHWQMLDGSRISLHREMCHVDVKDRLSLFTAPLYSMAISSNGEYRATFYLQRTNEHLIAEQSDGERINNRDKLNEPSILVIGETSHSGLHTFRSPHLLCKPRSSAIPITR